MKAKLNLFLVTLIFIAASCSGTKSTAEAKPKADPILGDWAIVIADTPQGDMESTLTMTKNEDGTYKGVIASDMGSMDLADVKVVESALTSTFEVQGMEFEFKGNFSETEFKGETVGMGSSFPTTGTKKTE